MSTTSRKLCRSGAACLPSSLAEAIACLGQHSDLSLPQIAERLGLNASSLGKACSPYDDGHQLALRYVVPMTLASSDVPARRNYAVLEHLARALGGVFVALPAATGDALLDAQLRAVQEFGEHAAVLRAALADGRIDPDEAERVGKEIDEAIAALVGLKHAVEQQAQSGPRRIA